MNNKATFEEVVQKNPIDVCIRILAREIDLLKNKIEQKEIENDTN